MQETCPALNIENGKVRYNTTVADGRYFLYTKATFTCLFGFSVNGSRFTVCQTSRTWNDPTPTCVGKDVS